MAAGSRLQPSLCEEEALWAAEFARVAGVDEVGRGPLAGPVYAAAVILDPTSRPDWLADLRDSKVITAAERERLAEIVRREALCYAVGWSSVAEIDAWGISRANSMAMIRALDGLTCAPHYALIDGPLKVKHPVRQRAIVDGDATCCSIAAASIVAKVARDELMCELDSFYPQYGFAAHKGYATRDHLRAIERHGLSIQHRRSWLAVQRRAAGGQEEGDVETS